MLLLRLRLRVVHVPVPVVSGMLFWNCRDVDQLSPDYCVSGSKELETCEFSCPIFSTMARLHLFVVLVRVLSHMSNNNHSQTGLFTVLHLLCSAACLCKGRHNTPQTAFLW